MSLRRILLSLLLLAAAAAALGPLKTHLPGGNTRAESAAQAFAAHNTTAYTLTPDKLRKAIALNRIDVALTLGGTVWAVLELLLILWLGLASAIRGVAVRLSASRWAQGFAFVFLLLLATGLLDLPLELYGHHTALAYGLSVQRWPGWFLDKAKFFALEWVLGSLLALLIAWVVRRSPTRWWFWFWIPAVLISVAGVFVTPYVIDPLFNKFEPLQQTDPALVEQLEKVVARSGMSIPPDRMFLMRASAKYTGLNAYVTGFGASKRIVVWDTTIAASTPDEIAYIFAHELGHYALGHVLTGTVLACAALLPFFWLGYRGTQMLLARFGAAWRIPAQAPGGYPDWAALAVLLLVLTTLSTLSGPIANAYSRRIEHAADVYGQEAVHGIVPDPQAVGLRSFQELGEDSLDDPRPHPLFNLWFATHPFIGFRAAFAEAYNPWAPGMSPKYFRK